MEQQSEGQTVLPSALTALDLPLDVYHIDEFKNGTIVTKHSLCKNRIIFGRARDCDIVLDHPSISRYHAALLWAPKNDDQFIAGTNSTSFWYLVDCGSTHGTTINKIRIVAGKTIKLVPNNNVFKFGASTRFFTLGSNEIEAEEQEQVATNSKARQSASEEQESDVCTWGMSMAEGDEEEKEEENVTETAIREIILAMKTNANCETANHNAYADNPYKSLQQWFDREGYDFDYKVDSDNDKFKCIIELPVDNQWIPVESSLCSRKKESITDCCLKCCKILDQASILFSWQKEKQKRDARKAFEQDNDDAEDMIDETIKSKKKKPNQEDKTLVDTFETLNLKWKEVSEELRKLKVKLAMVGLPQDVTPEVPDDAADSLDLYLASMNRQNKFGLNLNQKIEKSNLRMQIKQLETEQIRLEKLIELARPASLVNIPQTKLTAEKVAEPVELSPVTCEVKPGESATQTIEKKEAKPKPSVSSYKKMRKMAQESIVEAIEKEKLAEKQKHMVEHSKIEEEVVAGKLLDWVPPQNQTGDGKTHLNDKFGY